MTSVATAGTRRATPSLDAVKGSAVVVPAVTCVVAVALASLSLTSVLAGAAWFAPVLLVTLIVVGVGAIAMWLRAPLFIVPVLQVVALFSVLVARYTTSAVWGFLPWKDSLTDLRTMLTKGMHDISVYAPPVPVSPGVAAVVALGVGCLAIVVFVLQVTLRMPVIAGLALVSVYVVPSFVLDDGSPWWAFAALALAFMLLLMSDERVGLVSWGRMLRRSDSEKASPFSALSSAALRIGTAAIVAAVLLPVIVPGIADAVLGRSSTGSSPNGTAGTAGGGQLSPLVELRRHQIGTQNNPVFTYTGDGKVSYLPVVVLTSYHDEAWSTPALTPENATPLEDGVPPDPSLGSGTAPPGSVHSTVFTAERATPRTLPLPEHYTDVTVDGGVSWFVDKGTRAVFSDSRPADGITWSTHWSSATPTMEQLQQAPAEARTADDFARLPALSPKVDALAQQIVERAHATTTYEKARAIQDYFRDPANGYTYSTDVADPSGQSGDYLDRFLLVDKRGYCQQYAAAMALLAQAVGISAHVVVGYTQGSPGPGGTYVVRDKDAHAWPELRFTGVGWVRFEPTPSGPGTSLVVPGYTQGALPAPTPSASSSSGSACVARSENACQNGKQDRGQHGRDPDLTAGGVPLDLDPGTSADTWRLRGILAAAIVAALLAAVPAALRWLRRRRRTSEQAAIEDMWEELRDTARDLGIPWSGAQTPRQTVASVIEGNHLRGEDADAATRLGRATERARYAPTAPSTSGLAQDVVTVRRALWRRADRSTRWRATLLPASLRDQHDVRP